MEITLRNGVPPAWQARRPLREYETRLLYTGFSRYDVDRKVLSTIRVTPEGKLLYSERVHEGRTFSRVYAAEHVRVIVYSESPKVWAEEIAPYETHFFQQVST
jgi:hypothetical protein